MKFHLVILFLVGFFSVNVFGFGFEVELVHRDSLLSPLYNRSASLGKQARARFSRIISTDGGSVESVIHPGDGEFLIKLLVGTPPTVTYATVDTGSDLTWIQCTPCITCFTQNTSPFDPRSSATYHNLSCRSPLCQAFPRTDNSIPTCSVPSEECLYSYSYADTSSTVGVLATETFAFQMVNGSVTKHTDFVFGCGHDNRMSSPAGGSGIIGLGRGSLSLTSQVGLKVEKKFSYCFPKSAEYSSMFRFGSTASASISVTGKVVSTPLLSHETYPNLYFLTLEGITVGAKKIESERGIYYDKRNTVIDSGSILNYLESELFGNVVSTLRQLINLPTIEDPSRYYELCYSKESFSKLSEEQKLIFHFTGADIELKNANIFISIDEIICFSMASSTHGFNVYGNNAQKNFEVVYNLESNVLSFAPANCSQYPWKKAGGSRTATYSSLTSFLCIITLILVHVLMLEL